MVWNLGGVDFGRLVDGVFGFWYRVLGRYRNFGVFVVYRGYMKF